MTGQSTTASGLKRFIPRIGSPGYHVMLACVAMFILGPLGGISAAFMNFSIGFFVTGQVLAGILGSTVTLPYGPEGKHGGNYMQTMAASVADMGAMGVLLQAVIWLGLPEPPTWKLVLYLTCIGMFGTGIGMLYTPLLVDRMQLTYPSGLAVANILRALTDRNLLKRSIAKLGGGMLSGYVAGLASLKVAALQAINLSASTFGAGMIVGARIAIPALVVALIGARLQPYLVSIGWLQPGDPYRKIGFIIALGTILGAALLDIALILVQAVKRYRQQSAVAVNAGEDWKRVNTMRLLLWIVCWGAATIVVGSQVLHQPLRFLAVGAALSFVFVLVNGISQGISDWNPVSSAFVLTIFALAAFGLGDAGIGLMCASIVLIACSTGSDMQQDRSTGWRLGTNRVNQFRYQVIGILLGSVLAVVLAKLFMTAYPILRENQFDNPHLPGAEHWQSTMTYKFVGALKGITEHQPQVMKALALGIVLGLLIDAVRKLIKHQPEYKAFVQNSQGGRATDFALDAVLLPSPYASSFGGFVELPVVLWWTGGGIVSSLLGELLKKLNTRRAQPGDAEVPADMSTTSLIGGGLIAGDSLAALSVGLFGLIASGALKRMLMGG